MKSKATPGQCDHFTGSYVGTCRAGVAYESVKDQDRRGQMARFPCDRSLSSFTTCDRAQFTPPVRIRRRIDVTARNWQRPITYKPKRGEGEGVSGVLVGCSDDQATAFIRVRRSPKRTRVIAVPSARCHFEELPEAAAGDVAQEPKGGTLPLFEVGEGAAAPTTLESRRAKKAGRSRRDDKRSKAA
ncbi:MAG TPA: hypothetical protein VGB98_25825 [Pyrinomonadaceae bacterium]|jgi:hypothetical protein